MPQHRAGNDDGGNSAPATRTPMPQHRAGHDDGRPATATMANATHRDGNDDAKAL